MNRMAGWAGVSVLAILAAVPALGGGIVTYEKDIRPIVAARCAGCHGPDSPAMEDFDRDKDGYKKKGKGPRLDTYANLLVVVKGSDAGALMRRLDDGRNTKDGKPGNMHANLGSTDAERAANLEIFRKWVGNWTLKRKKELSKEELDAIRAPER
jgi:mono/diheme cytochrome c family protein